VLVAFPDETNAYECFHALAAAHGEGTATVHGALVVRRDGNGSPSVQKRGDGAPLGVGTLAGGWRSSCSRPSARARARYDRGGREISGSSTVDLSREAPRGQVVCEWLEDPWEIRARRPRCVRTADELFANPT
jgi:hypothetical protein